MANPISPLEGNPNPKPKPPPAVQKTFCQLIQFEEKEREKKCQIKATKSIDSLNDITFEF
jgi:hypothetical protein